MHTQESKLFTVVASLFITLLLAASLGLKCNVEGTRPENLAPSVRFANIPTEGTTFTSQPLIYWFGKDPDGFIAEYQYVVFKATQLDTLGFNADSTGVADSVLDSVASFLKGIPPDRWTDSLLEIAQTLQSRGEEVVKPVELVTQDGAGETNSRVQLFASANPQQIILQFIFLRVVDNADSVSTVIYRKFFRTNNPPNSKVEFNNKEVYYNLNDTTRTWKGITMGWAGTDSIDYPLGEAPLEFSWELFYVGLNPPADTLNPDTSNTVAVSYDSTDQDRWVTAKAALLPTGLQTGYYAFRVRSRDDAFIPDPTPAISVFYVIKYEPTKEILIVDISSFFVNATGCVSDPNIYQPRYDSMLTLAGHPADSIWYSIIDAEQLKEYPQERLLSQYKLVMLINQDPQKGITDSLGRQLIKYLDVGGKVWIQGIVNFTTAAFSTTPRQLKKFSDELRNALRTEAGYGVDIGSKYCGLERYFMPNWDGLADSVDCVGGSNCQPNYGKWPLYPEGRNEEFIGAAYVPPPAYSPYPSYPFPPNLELDTVNVKLASTLAIDRKIVLKDKLPHVNYAVVSSIHPVFQDLYPAEAVYLVNSAYGSGTNTMHGGPAVVWYQGPTFQTAVCTFPMFYIKLDQSVEFTRQLLAWFGLP